MAARKPNTVLGKFIVDGLTSLDIGMPHAHSKHEL